MKKYSLLPLLLFLLSCAGPGKKDDTAGDPEFEDMNEPVAAASKKKVTDRDHSITPSVAFNDIFLDSNAMEAYISRRNIGDRKIARRIRSFYNARNYQYAWFSSAGMGEQARLFWNQYDYAVNYQKDTTLVNEAFYRKANTYMNQEAVKVSTADSSLLDLEFGLTEYFIRYINSTYEKGYVKRKEQEKFIPIRKASPVDMADSLLNKKHSDDKYYEQVNERYAALKKQLPLYASLTREGGWPVIREFKGPVKRGDRHPALPLIKKRLRLTLDMPGQDSSDLFTDTLETAVKRFEQRHGYKPDGVITTTLVNEMNVPARQRLMQILLNMDRMRWMPQKPEGRLIIANIPEFMIHVYDGMKKEFDMVVVVGKVGHNTLLFNGDMNQVVFSPYWNVPPSIIKNEIEPALQRNPGYLERKNMERTATGIRQKPGPGNSLGKVKFVFPNSFNIYFHDTPAKSLFNEDKRAFSHGCIRLSEPQKMAEYVLSNDPDWPRDRIVKAMNQTYETAVRLKKPIPVFILYNTAWVDEDGLLQFREDVYQHDREWLVRMFPDNWYPEKGGEVIRVDNMNVKK